MLFRGLTHHLVLGFTICTATLSLFRQIKKKAFHFTHWYLLLPSLPSTEHLGRAGFLVYQEYWVSWASIVFLYRGSSSLGGSDLILLFPGRYLFQESRMLV